MKIGDNKYMCGFCGKIIEVVVSKRKGAGKKGTATSQIKCKCGNYINQKTSENMKK